MVIDSHCHLHDPEFTDVADTLRVALTYDVWGIIAMGCDAATNTRTLEIAAQARKTVWGCLGFHPDWDHLTERDLEAVERQIAEHHPHVVALGEVGLPWYSLEDRPDAAERMTIARGRLDRLLRLAARYDLAVALHAPHGAAVGALEALKRHRIERAVFHWHKASADTTRAIVDAGYFISVTPEVVYRDRDREMVEQVPLDSLLVESDAPWQYGGEFKAMDSGPWLASRVAEEVAKIKREPIEETMFQLSSNAVRLFDLVWA